MKADRRHELQENTLAHVLSNFPLYLSIYGGRILLGLSLVVLVFVLLNYRKQARIQQSENARIGLSSARESIGQIAQLSSGFGDPAQIAQQRSLLLSQATSQLDVAQANADTDRIKSETQLARGDLYWTLANVADVPGAATQPALALPEKRDDLLSKAEVEYNAVLAEHTTLKVARGSALLGLGAIAENRGKFDVARQQYDRIIDDDLSPTHKMIAMQRTSMLPILSKSRRITAATLPATQPAAETSAAPVVVEATTQPVEAPATTPAQ